jgi:hypothetical protein
MTRVARGAWVFALILASVGLQARGADAPLPPARTWVPKDAVLVVEVQRPQAVIDLLAGPKMTRLITTHPIYKQMAAGPRYQGMLQLVKYLEMQLGADWKSAASSLFQDGATMAMLPGGKVVLILDSGDATKLEKIHDVMVQITRGEAAKKGDADPVVSRSVQGVTTWTHGGKGAYALLGKRFVWGNTPEALETALVLRGHPDRPSLDTSATYKAARKAANPKAVATAYADVALLKTAPQFAELVKPADNPMTALLLAGLKESLQKSTWLGLGLRIDGESLALDAAMDGKTGGEGSKAAFMSPPAGKGALPMFGVPRQIAGMSFYRDLFTFYAAKDQLFPERTSGLIFFENMMGIFFSGRDLNGEIFAETLPEIRFVIAAQKYDPAVGTPEVKLPAFAMVVPSKHPDEFARVAEEAWQKGVGLISVTRGQRAEPGLILDRITHNDIKFTVATNAAGKADDKAHLPSRFNFSASMARVGDSFILSSTQELTCDLIDALKKTPTVAVKPLAGTNTVVAADGTQLAAILADNRETMVERNMVEKGNTRAKAEGEIDLITAVIKLARRAELTAGVADGVTRLTLGLDLNLP